MADTPYQYHDPYEQTFFQWAGITVRQARAGRAEAVMPVAPHHRGGGGTDAVNGGIGAYLFDGVLGAAVRSTWDEGVAGQVTMTLTIQYLRPLIVADTVVATARVTHRGRASVYVEGQIKNDQGEVAMTALGIFHLFRSHAY